MLAGRPAARLLSAFKSVWNTARGAGQKGLGEVITGRLIRVAHVVSPSVLACAGRANARQAFINCSALVYSGLMSSCMWTGMAASSAGGSDRGPAGER